MRAGLLCIDFDDTLVVNQAHFLAAGRRLAELCARELGADPASVAATFAATDAALRAHGRHRHRFLLSVVGTFCRMAGVESVPLALLPALAEIAALPYDTPPSPEPGVPAALAQLRRQHAGHLWLVTAGDGVVQEGRVRRSGLAGYFDAVHIVPEKTPDIFRRLGAGHQDPWMVGNAPAADILPALEAGFHVVHVAAPTWDLDVAPLPPGVPSVPDFPAAVAHLLAHA